MKNSKKLAAGFLLIATLATSSQILWAGDPAISPGYPNPQGTTSKLLPGMTDKLLPGMTTNPPKGAPGVSH